MLADGWFSCNLRLRIGRVALVDMSGRLAAVLIVLVSSGAAAAHAAPIFAVSQASQSSAITTAILIGASSTQAAVQKADAVVQALYRDLKQAEEATKTALKRAGTSDAARKKLEVELKAIQQQQETLMAQLAAKDTEYKANLRAYREGLTGLLAESDPRVVAVLERYAEGDVKAADELQALTRIIRKAREAGQAAAAVAVRTQNGNEQRAVARLWLDEKDRGRKTTTEVLAAWTEAAEIDPSDFWQWIEIGRLHQEAGDLNAAAVSSQSAVRAARTDRDRGVAQDQLGNVAVSQGRLEVARLAFEAGHDLARQLLSANPSSSEAKRDVYVSLSKVGDVALAQDRLEDARSAYEENRDLARQLLSGNPSSSEAKRDVYVSLSKVGDVALAQDRLEDARHAYEESRDLRSQLLSANPSSAQAKRDVNFLLGKIGDVAEAQGRLEDARGAYEESADLARQLLSASPSSAQAKRAVMVSHARLAQLPGLAANWRDALALAKDMAAQGVLAPADQWMLPELQRQVDALDGRK